MQAPDLKARRRNRAYPATYRMLLKALFDELQYYFDLILHPSDLGGVSNRYLLAPVDVTHEDFVLS